MENRTYFGLVFIALLFSGCFDIIKTEIPKYSSGIIDSKDKGAFIAEYQPSVSLLVHDSIEIIIKEAWMEHLWYYKNQFKQIKVSKDTILLISIDINNEDYFWKAPSIINYTSESLFGMQYTNFGGNKFKLEFPKYYDTISVIFWEEKELLLTKIN